MFRLDGFGRSPSLAEEFRSRGGPAAQNMLPRAHTEKLPRANVGELPRAHIGELPRTSEPPDGKFRLDLGVGVTTSSGYAAARTDAPNARSEPPDGKFRLELGVGVTTSPGHAAARMDAPNARSEPPDGKFRLDLGVAQYSGSVAVGTGMDTNTMPLSGASPGGRTMLEALGAKSAVGQRPGFDRGTMSPKMASRLAGIELGPGVAAILHDAAPVAALLEKAVEDVFEAHTTFAWLQAQHPGWWPLSSQLSPASCRDSRLAMLASQGSNVLSQARRAAQDLDRFLERASGSAVDDDVLCAYLQSVTDAAKRKRGEAFKGTAAASRLAGLKLSVSVLRAPYPLDALESRFAAAAAGRPSAPAVSIESAHMSTEEAASIEDIALGEFFEEVRGVAPPAHLPRNAAAVATARSLVIATIGSLRADDLRKARVERVSSTMGIPFADILVDKPKAARSRRKLVKFRLPFRGITRGVECWAPAFMSARIGRSFLIESFKGDVLTSGSLSGSLMDADDVSPCLLSLVGASLQRPVAELHAEGLTGHSLRHLLPEIATAAGWPDSDVDPLGRWSKRRDGTTPTRSAGAAYSAGVTSVEREYGLRSRALDIVHSFVGSSAWRDRLPVQRGGAKSFAFLAATTGNRKRAPVEKAAAARSGPGAAERRAKRPRGE